MSEIAFGFSVNRGSFCHGNQTGRVHGWVVIMASGSDFNGQSSDYFQIDSNCPNCETPVEPLAGNYRGLPLYRIGHAASQFAPELPELPVFVSVPQTNPRLVGVPHCGDVLERIPPDGSAVMYGSSHFELPPESVAGPVDALMDEFVKNVPRFLEQRDRFTFETTFSKLLVRDGASNASIFATADGHNILVCHPMAKVWVQAGQVCATFSLQNQEQR